MLLDITKVDFKHKVDRIERLLTEDTTLEESEQNSKPSELADDVTERNDELRISKEDVSMFRKSSKCATESWNNVTMDSVPNEDLHREWIEKGRVPIGNNTNSTSFGVSAAFVYPDHIAVTLTEQIIVNKTVFCRYSDCRKKEMVRPMQSFVFPEMTVYCPRRAVAKFISLTSQLDDKSEYSVPIQERLNPKHFWTICVVPDRASMLQLAEFIEYYKLQGAQYFLVYADKIGQKEMMLLEDYVRTGEVEIVKLSIPGKKNDNDRLVIQKNDCHHRSKYLSKWTAMLKIDDRLQMENKNRRVVDYLDSVTDPNINTLRWNSTVSSRLMFRPERVVTMQHEQNSLLVYIGENKTTEVDKSDGFLRFSDSAIIDNLENYADTVEEATPFRSELVNNVLSRVKWVYQTVDVSCEQKQRANERMNMNAECWIGK